jgi:DME family drug/metabolite transporter
MRIFITVPSAACRQLISRQRPVARRRPASGLLCLVASGLLWGTGGLTGTLLSRAAGLSAISVAAGRLTVGGLLIVAFLTVTGRRWPAGRAAWTRIIAVALLAALYQGCYFTAVSLTSVPLATLVTIGTAPVIVLAAERAAGRKAGRLALAAAGLALAGLGLLVGLPAGFGESAVLASAGMAVLAAGGFAAITLTCARPVPGLDDLTVTGFGFTLGGGALIPLAACTGGLSFRPGLAAFGLLIALGIGPTAVAYTLYFRGLRTAAASTAALLSLLEPLTGAVLAAFILGERLSATGIAGAVILAAAVILTVRADRGHPAGGHGSGEMAVPADGGAGGSNGVDRVGGDDGGDAEPGAPRQRLAQDHQADDGGQDRVHAHEEPEVTGWHPAQRG